MDDGNVPAVNSHFQDFDRLEQHLFEMEGRIITAIYWFGEYGMRITEAERARATVKQRLANIEERLTEVEKRLNFPSAE